MTFRLGSSAIYLAKSLLRSFSVSTLVLSFLMPSSVYARLSTEELFERLKDSAIDFDTQGKICEVVEVLNLEDQYPAPRHKVMSGIKYKNPFRTLGEIDAVVFDLSNQTVIRIEEVKCWNEDTLSVANRKAREQLDRLYSTMQSTKPIEIYDPETLETFERVQFRSLPRSDYHSVAQKVDGRSRFDEDLGFYLDELRSLRARLINCQRTGPCAKPVESHVSRRKASSRSRARERARERALGLTRD